MRLACANIAALIMCLAAAQPSQAATINVAVNASANKPLLLTKLQDLDLGTVSLNPGTWTGAVISLSQAGVLTCNSANVTCAGLTQVSQYNVQGSNQQVVRITAPNVLMTNQSDSSKTLLLTTSAPASVTLTNSGAPGTNFSIGGSVTLNSTTTSGTYVGTFNVTADYQ